MKGWFWIIPVVLLLMSLAAWRIDRGRDRRSALWSVDANELREEQLALFRKLNPDLPLRIDPSSPDLTKTLVQSIGGVGPDLFCVYDPAQLTAAVKSGIALDVTDEFGKAGIDLAEKVWPGSLDCAVYGGRLYGVPNNVGPIGMWFDREAFDEAGIPYPSGPWSWEEFLKVAPRLVKRDAEGRIERHAFGLDWNCWPHFVMQWGGSCYNADGTRCTIDSPEAVAAVTFMSDLVYRYKLAPTPVEESAMASAGGWGQGTLRYFASGRYATALGGRWWLMMLRQHPELRSGVCESPHGPVRVFQCTAKATVVNAASPHREIALGFLRYLLSEEYNQLVTDQGDALGPLKSAGRGDPEVEVWRGMMAASRPIDRSDFINGLVAARLISRQLDLVKNRLKSPADAMRDAARDVNIEICRSVLEDPELQECYRELTGRSLTRADLRKLEEERREESK